MYDGIDVFRLILFSNGYPFTVWSQLNRDQLSEPFLRRSEGLIYYISDIVLPECRP